MKAIVWTAYGPPDVLQLKEVEKPAPKSNEVLIKIHATTVTAGDCEIRELKIPVLFRLPMRIYVGFRSPHRLSILGQQLAGEIEATGDAVTRFRKGDQVFAATGLGFGAYAEYICLPENSEDSALALKPANMTYEEAAVVPVGGLDALHFLRKAAIRKGQGVLIYGAGGGIGTFAVQLSKHFGAEVTAVDSTDKLDMLHSIGAYHVIDYKQEDFTRNGVVYDVIFDIVGKISFTRSIRSLKANGFYLLANPGITQMLRGLWTSTTSSRKVVFQTASHKTKI